MHHLYNFSAADLLPAALVTALATSGPDLLPGSDLADVLSGLGGDDTLIGNGGDDRLSGGDGSDRLYGGAGQNTLMGGAGGDGLFGDDDLDFLQGGPDLIFGGGGGDYIDAGQGDDTVYGGSGDDTIIEYIGLANAHGGKGNDLMLAEDGTLWGDAGNDTIQGDLAYGGAGNDSVLGGGYGSMIFGGAGLDTLTAISAEADTLTGGSGADDFVFFETSRGTDRITDYNAGQDMLDLTDFGVTGATLGAHATQVGADVQILLDGSTGGTLTVIVANAQVGDLVLV